MAKGIRKGSELSNISETWDQNEQKRQRENAPARENVADSNLEKTIKEEATEYEQDKKDRVLGGDRATVNDDRSNVSEG
jgi:hypothetical protein